MAASFPTSQAIVVGGGLGGMSAANTVVENGGRVVLLDKSSFCGGNSTKATSGINGAGTKTQQAKGIPDNAEIFTQDTMKGGAKKPELAKLLCVNSAADVEARPNPDDWLVEKFNLDLSLVARLGGHSQPRTHRGKERFPGMTITYALIQMLEKVAEKTDLARIVTKAKVFKLVTEGNACVGCVYEKGGQNFQEFGPVILASGGFGADFTSNSLLAQYRPDLLHLPTTNGEHCTGDGIKMGEAIGAKSIDLEWVQVHPTGLVKPDDAEAKIKFLAAEALRGVGGIILNAEGKRFCNELGRRDYVTGEMWKSKPPFRHYTGRGVMKYYATGDDLAKDMGVPLAVIEETHEDHYQAAKKTEKDPDGGSWPAYPSGKSWDQASGMTGSGKKFYHNIIPGSAVKSEPFYVAIITPVIHYCMGGLLIDTDSACIGANNQPIPGLYAAGEVAGGVHGNNRLGGNSLLDCVVFGRVAGKAAAKYMLGADMKEVDLCAVSGGGLTGAVESSKLAGGSYEDKMNSAPAPGAAAVAAAPAANGGGGGGITMADVAKHNSKTDCWVVVDGQVLDVTSFLGDHPGGELAILTFAGKDATEEFNMIHPPDVIGKYAPDSVIGMIGGGGGGAVAAAAPAGGGGGGISMAEVAKHNSKSDCWVVVDGQVLDVTSFLSEHPGGELAILTFAGRDATEEFNMIHPPDVIGKYCPESVIGALGSGAPAAAPAASGGLAEPLLAKGGHQVSVMSSYTLAEVAKHNSKTDCWVVVDGQVLDVTSFLSEHPGGELAIITFAGKDATEEFNMIHPPDVIPKYAPESIVGKVGGGAPAAAVPAPVAAAPAASAAQPLLNKGHEGKDWSRSEKNRELRMKGEGKIPGWWGAAFYMVLGFLKEVLFTIYPQKNVSFTSDRVGLTRSAMFLFVFIIIHAVGNLHVFLGPDDFNGYGYFYVRLYWTGFGLQANIVEEYILLAALLHVIVAIKRTWDISVNYALNSGKMNLAISGVTLLTFMMIHLYQFRFGATEPWTLCPPPYLLNLKTLLQLRLNLFWVDDPGCQTVAVRDIYRMEFEVFQSLGWCLFYVMAVIIFSTHMCLGWQKVVPAPALEIPKKYHSKATHMGYIFTIFIAMVYVSFPLYCHIFTMSSGSLSKEPATP